MSDAPRRVVTDTMIGMSMADSERWSERVGVVLGQNPGPFTGPGTNTYVIGTGSRRVLLDTGQGVDAYTDLLERALSETPGLDGIEEILITHAHPDHIGGVESILERFGSMRVSKKPRTEMDRGLELSEIDEGAEISTAGATLQALWTPGHAIDHLCFYMPEERALFTGDMVLGAGTTVIPRDGDLGDYMASLRRLMELDVDVIYPAHGPKITEPRAKIESYIQHRELRDRQILGALEGGPAKVERIVDEIYTDVPEAFHAAAAVSVEAHLRRFEKGGRVVKEGETWRRA